MPIPANIKLIDGPIPLAGNFPPTLNKEQDRTKLEVNESPDCYGADWDVEGVLKTGTIPTGVARIAPVGTGSYTDYNWYYNRLMKINSVTASQLDIGSPEYRSEFYDQDVGSRTCWADLITFMPMLQEALLLITATGSHIMENMRDPRGFFWLGDFEQGFFAEAANRVTTLRGVPFACNATGVYSWDGKEVTEWTRPVRNDVAPFSATAITCDYDERLVIGTDKFVVDTSNGRLFDYSTSGFRFTSRTLVQPIIEGLQPYTVSGITFLLDIEADGQQKIEWESKLDNGNWFTEPDIIINDKEKQITRVIEQPVRMCREFTARITSMTAGVKIREIQLMVIGYAQEAL